MHRMDIARAKRRMRGKPVAYASDAVPKKPNLPRTPDQAQAYEDMTVCTEGMAEVLMLAEFPAENPSPLLRVAQEGTILYANKASADLLRHWGCQRGEALAVPWRNLVADTLESSKTRTTEVLCGTKVYTLMFSPVGQSRCVNVYGLDITERKQAEEEAIRAQQALVDQQRREKERIEAELARTREELIRTTRLATIGQVSASIAHDLRNPLGSVRNVRLSTETPPPPGGAPDRLGSNHRR